MWPRSLLTLKGGAPWRVSARGGLETRRQRTAPTPRPHLVLFGVFLKLQAPSLDSVLYKTIDVS